MAETKETKQLGVKLDAELWKQIKIIALEQDTTATELMNQAMQEFIAKHKGVRPIKSPRVGR